MSREIVTKKDLDSDDQARFNLKMSAELYTEMQRECEARGINMSEFVRSAIKLMLMALSDEDHCLIYRDADGDREIIIPL